VAVFDYYVNPGPDTGKNLYLFKISTDTWTVQSEWAIPVYETPNYVLGVYVNSFTYYLKSGCVAFSRD